MKTFDYVIQDELGIHARPAGVLVKTAKSFTDSKITVAKGEKTADATKLFALMGLVVKKGDTVTVSVDGGDEEAVADAMKDFFKNNL